MRIQPPEFGAPPYVELQTLSEDLQHALVLGDNKQLQRQTPDSTAVSTGVARQHGPAEILRTVWIRANLRVTVLYL